MTANDRDAARGATESDFPCCEVVGEGSDAQKARLARYAEALRHHQFDLGAAQTGHARCICGALLTEAGGVDLALALHQASVLGAVADAEQAELKAEVERLRRRTKDLFEDATAQADRAEAAEAALVSEREAHAGLRARLEALAESWTKGIGIDRTMGATKADVEPLERLIGHFRAALAAEPAAPVAAEEGDEQEAGEVVHDGTGAVDGVTRCCGERMTDLPPNERVTMFESQVTCQRAGDEPEPLWDCFICGGRFPSGHGHSPAKDGSDEQGNRPATPDTNGVHDTKGGEGRG